MQLLKISKVINCDSDVKERWIRKFNWQQKRAFIVANCYLSPPLLLDYMWFCRLHTDLEFIGLATIVFVLSTLLYLICV